MNWESGPIVELDSKPLRYGGLPFKFTKVGNGTIGIENRDHDLIEFDVEDGAKIVVYVAESGELCITDEELWNLMPNRSKPAPQ